MKKIIIILMMCVLGAAGWLPASASDRAEESRGYFPNTRTVLLLPAESSSDNGEEGAYLASQTAEIFRYPYYHLLEYSDHMGQAGSMKHPREENDFEALARVSGADIVVLPQIVLWSQVTSYPLSFFDDDADPVVQTRAVIRLLSWEKGNDHVLSAEVRYFDTSEEGIHTDWKEIMGDMVSRLLKKFPYQRIPADISTNLSGPVRKI